MDASESEPDYSSLPIEERVVHKVWKVRSEAYAELKSNFDNSGSETDDCFDIFNKNPDLLKKIVADSNVIAQEAGIALLASYLKNCGSKACISSRKTIIPVLCEKTLGSTRQGTKQNTLESILYYIELDTPEPVIELILPILSSKMAKLVAGSVKLLNDCYIAFGCKVISPKLVLPHIPKLFQHIDKNVKAETTNLSITLRSWMGDTFDSIIFPDLMKEVQKKDLAAAFEKIEGKPSPTRILKSQQKIDAAAANASVSNADGEDVEMVNVSTSEEVMDVFDMVEAVDILSLLPTDLESRLSSSIWKERVGVLDEVTKEISNVKKVVPNGNYGDLIRLMARCMKDANIQVVTLACNIAVIVANGLRNEFQKYVHLIFTPTLERTKEKKQSVLDALHSVLFACFQYSSFSEVFDTIIDNTAQKSPQVKMETLKFLVKCLQNTPTCPKKSEISILMDTCIKLLKDPQAPVRNLACECIGTLMKITGERKLNPFLTNSKEASSSVLQTKIKEFYGSATVKASDSSVTSVNNVSSSSSSSSTSAPIRRSATATTSAASAKRPTQESNTSKSSLVNTRLVNPSTLPSKRGPPSPTRKSEQPSSISRLGNGLASRNLAPTSHSLLPPPGAVERRSERENYDNQFELQKKYQLEREKFMNEIKNYENQISEFQMEKEKFLNEIKNLNNKNDQLRNEIANVTVYSKSKDTQIQRLTNDVDRLNRRIRELENVSVNNVNSSSLSPVRHDSILGSPATRKGISPIRFNNANTGSLSTLDSIGIGINHNSDLSAGVSGLTINSKLNQKDPQKENKLDVSSELSGVKNSGLRESFGHTSTSTTNNNNSITYETDVTDELWERQRKTTEYLRQRIQMIKNRTRVPVSESTDQSN